MKWTPLLGLLLITSAHATSPTLPPPTLMLAETWQAAHAVNIGDYWVSEKLDGVRGHWTGHQLLSRSGRVIPAPHWYTDGWPETPMDGELWMEHGAFEQVSGIVRSQRTDDADWRRVQFMLFDLPAHGGDFSARVAAMEALVRDADIAWLQMIPQQRMSDADALTELLDAVVDAGGEGLMLHHHRAHYRAGRSGDLLKLKRWDDAEARVIAHLPGQGRLDGVMGALLVERPDGRRFRLGSGFTDAQRRDPPPLGSRVTYRYSGLTASGLPRFAHYHRQREDE